MKGCPDCDRRDALARLRNETVCDHSGCEDTKIAWESWDHNAGVIYHWCKKHRPPSWQFDHHQEIGD